MLTYFLNLSFILNILLTIYVLFAERKHYASTWAWILIITFVPIIGFIAYLFLGHDMKKRKTFVKKEEEDRYMHLLHKQMLHVECNPCLEEHCPTICCQDVLKLHLIGHEILLSKSNHVSFFADGHEKFQDLFQTIRLAKKYVHLEYYIIHDDYLGKLFQELLIQKAMEGVDVMLLYDGMGCHKTPPSYFKQLQQAGVHVACFFPSPFPYITLRLNYRNHRKLCIIDGHTAYLGGFNVGDEYLGKNKKMGYWRDTHLKIIGDGAGLADLQFILDWRFATHETLPLQHYLHTAPSILENATGVPLQLVASGPDSKYSAILHGYIKMINEAKHTIYIQTPYFIPDDALLTALKLAALSGVAVHIMIPNKPDHMFVYWATYSYIGEVLAAGAKCYTYEKGFLHAKTIVIDDEIASVGTSNFDIRSFRLNFEMNAFIYDARAANSLSELFLKDLTYCKEITTEVYQNRSLLIKFKEPIARLLSPIL
ncbi:MAG: cardiolipin synthase [Cellulosilyticaceae bacterium]